MRFGALLAMRTLRSFGGSTPDVKDAVRKYIGKQHARGEQRGARLVPFAGGCSKLGATVPLPLKLAILPPEEHSLDQR
jgi:hypothetical protein